MAEENSFPALDTFVLSSEKAGKKTTVLMALFGAHILSWKIDGVEQLWLSKISIMDGKSPVRGGIPIAFPAFADLAMPALPLHGFARTQKWQLGERVGDDRVRLQLVENATTLALWPHAFRLSYEVRLKEGGTKLQLELTVENPSSFSSSSSTATTASSVGSVRGSDFAFTGCLHTYLRFDDANTVRVKGFTGVSFLDKCNHRVTSVQDDLSIAEQQETKKKAETGVDAVGTARKDEDGAFSIGAEAALSGARAGKKGYVDRVYTAVPLVTVTSSNPAGGLGNFRNFRISQSESWPNTTVYNPWQGDKLGGKAAGLDFDEDGYLHLLCIEPTIGNPNEPIILKPGGLWKGTQTLEAICSL